VNTYRRQPFLTDADVRAALREGIERVRQTLPFAIDAWVLLRKRPTASPVPTPHQLTSYPSVYFEEMAHGANTKAAFLAAAYSSVAGR
jgi:hypothetical protein